MTVADVSYWEGSKANIHSLVVTRILTRRQYTFRLYSNIAVIPEEQKGIQTFGYKTMYVQVYRTTC